MEWWLHVVHNKNTTDRKVNKIDSKKFNNKN